SESRRKSLRRQAHREQRQIRRQNVCLYRHACQPLARGSSGIGPATRRQDLRFRKQENRLRGNGRGRWLQARKSQNSRGSRAVRVGLRKAVKKLVAGQLALEVLEQIIVFAGNAPTLQRLPIPRWSES